MGLWKKLSKIHNGPLNNIDQKSAGGGSIGKKSKNSPFWDADGPEENIPKNVQS